MIVVAISVLSLVGCVVNIEKAAKELSTDVKSSSSSSSSSMYCFSVTPIATVKKRKYILYANNEDEMNKWVVAIQTQIDKWNLERIDRHSIKEGFINGNAYLILKENNLNYYHDKPHINWYIPADIQYNLYFYKVISTSSSNYSFQLISKKMKIL